MEAGLNPGQRQKKLKRYIDVLDKIGFDWESPTQKVRKAREPKVDRKVAEEAEEGEYVTVNPAIILGKRFASIKCYQLFYYILDIIFL